MTKQEFSTELREKLSGLTQTQIDEWVSFYGEIIDDRIEEGVSEEEAISAMGTLDEIVTRILEEVPLSKLVKEKIKPKRRLRAWEIVLLTLGSPIWLSLLIAAFAVAVALYASVCSIIVSLWAVFGSLIGCAVGGVAAGVFCFCFGFIPSGLVFIAGALVCAGLSIFMFFGCREATKGILWLTKKTVLGIKKCFVGRKERA